MSVIFNYKKKDTVDSNSPFAITTFSNMLSKYISTNLNHNHKEIVIVCIGTDRSTGDCLGPLIGYKLSSLIKKYKDVHLMGTLDTPVHAKNLVNKINFIERTFEKPFIIAIDACLGKLERVGYVSVGEGPLKPGAGVNKDLPEIGNLHITGIVNVGGFMEYVILQNTRLSTVMQMANVISCSLNYSIWKVFKDNERTIYNYDMLH